MESVEPERVAAAAATGVESRAGAEGAQQERDGNVTAAWAERLAPGRTASPR
jgi:hypothetical protein